MGAGTVTLRVGDRLVGVRADTAATRTRLETRFAAWIEPDATLPDGSPVPWAFSLRLEPGGSVRGDPPAVQHRASGRGPRSVPQLRIGSSLLARSRDRDTVMDALDHVLGGVLARQDESRRWIGLRPFAAGDDIVLVDATPPALTAHPPLARAGVAELPVWSVAVDDRAVSIPPALSAGDAAWTTYRLAGLVAIDPCVHESPADREAHHPTTPGSLLARFATRHPSAGWFEEVRQLVESGRVVVAPDRPAAAQAIIGLSAPAAAPG